MKGFFDTPPPFHYALIEAFREMGYYSSFFYGQNADFHNKRNFLTLNGIDHVYDNLNFPETYKKGVVSNYFWGYDDNDLFQFSAKKLTEIDKSHYFSLWFTGSMHSPFQISSSKAYDKIVKQLEPQSAEMDFIEKYQKYLQPIPFTDQAIKTFFMQLKESSLLENSIVIITGDHPNTELLFASEIKRYLVPLIIYSPKFNRPQTIESVSSHWDIAPSLLSYLHAQFNAPVSNNQTF